MSKKPSFEELFKRKLNDLPTPDEDEAWQKMKQLLDEKKKRRVFFLLSNYKVASGALVLLLILFSLTVFRDKTTKQKNSNSAKKTVVQKQTAIGQMMNGSEHTNLSFQQPQTSSKVVQKQNVHNASPATKSNTIETQSGSFSFSKNKRYNTVNKKSLRNNNEEWMGKSSTNKKEENGLMNKKQEETKLMKANAGKAFTTKNDSVNNYQNNMMTEESANNKNQILSLLNTSDSIRQQVVIEKDGLQKTIRNDSNKITTTTKIVIKKRNHFFVDAGIQVQQQIPIGTQKLIADNYDGNKNILLDYIPALYIRLEKREQWFLQGEFVYTSPRTVKQFTYSQQTQTDYAHGTVATTAYRLQKIFYNEAPLSFHYYIHPHWSIGAGASYNWLKGAMAQKTTFISNAQSGSQTLSQQVMPIKNFTDSFFYKSGTSLLLQTDYTKNRWSFGFRYLQDVQPFIRYTLPDGTVANKRNASLQLLIRYRLFRSSFKTKKK